MHSMEEPDHRAGRTGQRGAAARLSRQDDGRRAPAGRAGVPAGRNDHRRRPSGLPRRSSAMRAAKATPLVGAHRAAAVRLGAGVAFRFRCRAARRRFGCVMLLRLELRRSPATDRARLRSGVRRHLGAAARAAGGAGRVAAAPPLGQRADRRHPRQAISRQRASRRARRCRFFPRFARCWPRRRRSSGWRSISARTGRRRRCGRWCGIICIPRRSSSSRTASRTFTIYNADHRPIVQVPASGMVTALEPIMRACSGRVGGARRGRRGPRDGGPFRPIRVPPGRSVLHVAARMADRGAGTGLLLRIFQRGALAAVPSGLRAAGVSAERLARLRGGQCQVRRGRRGGGEHRQSRGADPGFSLRAAAEAHPREDPKATIALFWHIPWPNAETFGVCPVEARDAAAHAVGRHPRVSHALSLPEFSRHRGSIRGMPDRPRAHDRDAAGTRVPRGGLSDLDRVAASLAAVPARCRRLPRGRARAARDRADVVHRARASSAGTSPRESSSASRRWRHCWSRNPRHRGRITLAADRLAVAQPIAGVPGAAAADLQRSGAHQCQVRARASGGRSC